MAKHINDTERVSNMNITTCKRCKNADVAHAVEKSHYKILEDA